MEGLSVTASATPRACLDGNEAAARVAYALSEVIAIYPITPASPMGELSDQWAAKGRPNLWGTVPEVVEMQSEAGAAGAVHGALQKGALATTFTASQGLLLMIPNMYKIAGELTPAVIHVAARSLATHALSIFGDHSDVMAARSTGFAILASSSVQEAHDLAAVAHAATLEARVPFLHFFDGFRTSHEIDDISLLTEGDLTVLVSRDAALAHRERGITPDRPVLRGSAQNPDVFFQAREASNPYYLVTPDIVQTTMDHLAQRTGRSYHLVDYYGHPEAERVVVVMGSAFGALKETVDALAKEGERIGVAAVRLYRPFPAEKFASILPATTRSIAVLDRTKEPGAVGEPLYQDVVAALADRSWKTTSPMPRVVGGRYGLSSKEFTPGMAKSVFDELGAPDPKNPFTVGIVDDVTRLSLEIDETIDTDDARVRAVFFGLGSDGTVSSNKNTVKIVAEGTEMHAQGYFVYDSKKSGSVTVSHLRFSDHPIHSTYLIRRASFVACHQSSLLGRRDVLSCAENGATFLLNSPYDTKKVWRHLPERVRRQIVEKDLSFWVIDAHRIARELGMGTRINTIMQPCFFQLSGLLPHDDAVIAIKGSIERTYGRLGQQVVDANLAAVERGLQEMHRVAVPSEAPSSNDHGPFDLFSAAPDFVQRVTARMLAGEGDLLPVSALPVEGTWPTGTSRFEKRSIAQDIPIWDPDICIDCGHCAIVCPHAAVLMRVYDPEALEGAPEGFRTKDFHSKELRGANLTIQVAPDDCTGCGICVEVCPVKSKTTPGKKAINMEPVAEHLEVERKSFDFFRLIDEVDTAALDPGTVKGSQVRRPLFEFSGACAGCGETPYLKLLTQLFGDRMIVANATGCSSIFGGNLPTTPWATNDDNRGPAWVNSLFEDNAEFGLGIKVALERLHDRAEMLLRGLEGRIEAGLMEELTKPLLTNDTAIAARRASIATLKERLAVLEDPDAEELSGIADELLDRSLWIIGGDGWAYDIGSSGLDHVLGSGRDVNILVLDTEVYSNTGGQASKATPRGAVAKFASRGKPTGKKDLGMIASSYGDVYVAQIALGADYTQTIKALREAEAHEGPSLVIAYSTCIEHGIDMKTSMSHQKDAVRSGYWPLYRYIPTDSEHEHPFHLDSRAPSIPLEEFVKSEARFAMLARSDPDRSRRLLDLAQRDVDERWRFYEQLAGVERTAPRTTDDG